MIRAIVTSSVVLVIACFAAIYRVGYRSRYDMVSARTMPTWLLSHGSPMSLYEPGHPAYRHWVAIGKEIRQLKPRGIVIVSAHWQADGRKTLSPGGTVEVDMNTNTSNPLIYDFYNFPKHYYDAQFHSSNPAELQQLISQQLTANGIHVRATNRGIDHGVWVPLKSAFGETLEIPLTQISLPIERSPKVDAEASLRLGAALRALRAQDVVVIGSGQTVHNLRDFFGGKDGGYSDTFPLALYDAIQQHTDQERRQKALSLFDRPDYRSAHPTQEHLLPLIVAIGSAQDGEVGIKDFEYRQGGLVWDMYRFGAVTA